MKIPDDFGCLVFNENTMKKRLPNSVFLKLKQSICEGFCLDEKMCNIIAKEMKNWAIEHGATHFAHWFQPMSGTTAEKYESFIYKNKNGNVIMNFSGKELIKGETDASSFYSGELRSTFQARGYTIWDPTSYAFIKDKTLCIPAIFCSYRGECLDNKIPLLKSMNLINKHSLRILNLFGNKSIKCVIPAVGAEQEYFLIDKKFFEARDDLRFCKRTLWGETLLKNKTSENHYFSPVNSRVSAYMKDVDLELWKLGILSKTKHNEVAPAQHELAPFFTAANTSVDQNLLIMEILQTVAERHNLCCLFHEKPFSDINGSGKHINWSLFTDNGQNLFEPGESPNKNKQFLLFICAVIKGVDEYQELLRTSVASAENDLRLGTNEAPGPILSIFLGDELTEILNSFENNIQHNTSMPSLLDIGICTLPKIQKDTSDRNRTSPFVFNENKFEFRMVGSSSCINFPITVINTIVASSLCQFADELESCSNFDETLNKIIFETIEKHKRIIFNGDNYSDKWIKSAKKRGLCCLKTAVDAIPELISSKNIELFERYKIYSKSEIIAQHNVMLKNYNNTLQTEASVIINMAKKHIIPAVTKYIKNLCETALAKKQILNVTSCNVEAQLITLLSELSSKLYQSVCTLEKILNASLQIPNQLECATFCQDKIIPTTNEIRTIFNKIELNLDKELLPFPSCPEILLSV